MLAETGVLLDNLANVLWNYLGIPALVIFGVYLTIRSRGMQVRRLPELIRMIWHSIRTKHDDAEGVHPLKAFFASLGGCVGIGNVVLTCTAIQIGGPGALFWMWVTAFAGMLVKYSEVFLGIKFRVRNAEGGYDGGPAYYLQRAFKGMWIPKIVCLFLCFYGVEIFQFNVVATSISTNFGWNYYAVVLLLLAATIWAGRGGVARVGQYCSALIPVFTVLFVGMGFWVLGQNITLVPSVLALIVKSAFTGHAAVGGFAGSTLMLAMSQGVRVGCYAGDIGVGYAAVIHSESSQSKPGRQALFTIMEIIIDNFVICSTSVALILVTGVWKAPMDPSVMVQSALSQYFPYMNIFMPAFLFLLGYSTIIAFFCFGIKAAKFLAPKRGVMWYYVYATVSLVVFSFVSTAAAALLMQLCCGLLLLINVYGVYKLRHELAFDDEVRVTSTFAQASGVR